jgi:hypothetical protein
MSVVESSTTGTATRPPPAWRRDDGARRSASLSGQPSAKVVDAGGIGAAQSQPRFLNGVVHLAQRAEHPVSHGAQVRSVLFEPFGQILEFVHRSHFLVAFRHNTDGPAARNVTTREMRIEPHVRVMTLGVEEMNRAKGFYRVPRRQSVLP